MGCAQSRQSTRMEFVCLAALVAPALSLAAWGCEQHTTTRCVQDTAADTDAELPQAENMCTAYPAVALDEAPAAPAADCSTPSPVAAMIETQQRATQQAADDRRAELLDPGVVTVVACGTGSPIPSARAQSCTAVFANGKFLLFDAGDGAQRSMEDLGLPVDAIRALFITHFHSDHVADVGEVISRSWILGRTSELPVHGGEGVQRLVDGFTMVYVPDEAYRIAHHGEALFPPASLAARARTVLADPDGVVVFEEDGVVVRAFAVDHAPVSPSLAFRVEFGGRSVAVSGDTVDTPGLRRAARDVDVLVSEVMNKDFVANVECALGATGDERNRTIMQDIRTYHIDVAELGQLAEQASVKTLLLTHQVPSLEDDGPQDLVFRAPIAAEYNGNLVVARDGDQLPLPVELP